MAIKLSPDELSVLRAFKVKLQKGDISWAQKKDNGPIDNETMGNLRAFMYEKGVNLFKGMNSIPANFFGKASLDEVTIPDTVTEIGDRAFAESNIKSVICEDGVEVIDTNAFAGSKINHIELPNSIHTIKSGAFANCDNLKELLLPDGVTELKADIFAGDEEINIWANARKVSSRLKCPDADIEWFKKHLFKYVSE